MVQFECNTFFLSTLRGSGTSKYNKKLYTFVFFNFSQWLSFFLLVENFPQNLIYKVDFRKELFGTTKGVRTTGVRMTVKTTRVRILIKQ